MELNTINSHCFIYQTEELLVELLGGIRVDELDRMRVTMKVISKIRYGFVDISPNADRVRDAEASVAPLRPAPGAV
jgi:hypothetical protein